MTGNKIDAAKGSSMAPINPIKGYVKVDGGSTEKDSKRKDESGGLAATNVWDFAKNAAGAMFNPGMPNVNHSGAAGFEASATQPTYA